MEEEDKIAMAAAKVRRNTVDKETLRKSQLPSPSAATITSAGVEEDTLGAAGEGEEEGEEEGDGEGMKEINQDSKVRDRHAVIPVIHVSHGSCGLVDMHPS